MYTGQPLPCIYVYGDVQFVLTRVVADKDLRGQNVLQMTYLSLLRELLTMPQEQVFLPQHEPLPHHR